MSAKPELTRCADQRAEPALTISAVIVKASAGLCTRVARKTPIPAAPRVPRVWKSAAAAISRRNPAHYRVNRQPESSRTPGQGVDGRCRGPP